MDGSKTAIYTAEKTNIILIFLPHYQRIARKMKFFNPKFDMVNIFFVFLQCSTIKTSVPKEFI